MFNYKKLSIGLVIIIILCLGSLFTKAQVQILDSSETPRIKKVGEIGTAN